MVRRKTMLKGRISRIGRYAIASSITDQCITCTTFNILAPIYKRLSDDEDDIGRESDYRAYWLARNRRILDWLLRERSTIICLQEYWVGNEELVSMYEKRLSNAGYISFQLARTNNRGDGLLTAVHRDYFSVINHRDLLLNDFGDRVAQLLHVELVSPCFLNRSNNVRQEILIVNTHLLFPHDSTLCLVRLHQVYEILQNVESYQKEFELNPMPILLCGDWNGSKRGHVYKFLRSQGFVSSYDTAHQYTDDDAHKWVSHRNHRGNICGVDFIWLLNPNRYRKLLKTSWNETVFSLFKSLLRRASLTVKDAFAFLKVDSEGDYVTYSGFCEALRQLKLAGHRYGLSEKEMKDLWVQADIDGNGVLDYCEFQQRIWYSEDLDDGSIHDNDHLQDPVHDIQQAIGFSVKNAVLFPTEVEKGMWPEDYSLSDHARLTVVLSPDMNIRGGDARRLSVGDFPIWKRPSSYPTIFRRARQCFFTLRNHDSGEDGCKEGHGYVIYYEEGENDEVERIVHRVYMSFLWDRSYILEHVFFLTHLHRFLDTTLSSGNSGIDFVKKNNV